METTSTHKPADDRIETVSREIAQRFASRPGALLMVLQAIQEHFGYIPAASVPVVGQWLQRSRAEIQGVISFYPHLRQHPAGRHVVQVCRAEACQAMQGEALARHASQRLGMTFETTRTDGMVSLESVYCLGLCAQAPALMLDGQPHARMSPVRLDTLLDDLDMP